MRLARLQEAEAEERANAAQASETVNEALAKYERRTGEAMGAEHTTTDGVAQSIDEAEAAYEEAIWPVDGGNDQKSNDLFVEDVIARASATLANKNPVANAATQALEGAMQAIAPEEQALSNLQNALAANEELNLKQASAIIAQTHKDHTTNHSEMTFGQYLTFCTDTDSWPCLKIENQTGGRDDVFLDELVDINAVLGLEQKVSKSEEVLAGILASRSGPIER